MCSLPEGTAAEYYEIGSGDTAGRGTGIRDAIFCALGILWNQIRESKYESKNKQQIKVKQIQFDNG